MAFANLIIFISFSFPKSLLKCESKYVVKNHSPEPPSPTPNTVSNEVKVVALSSILKKANTVAMTKILEIFTIANPTPAK